MSYKQDRQTGEHDGEHGLVRLSQQGDRSAFNQLVERHQAGAYAVAVRMLGDPDVAADVTQDAFFSAYRAIGTFHGSSFRAWLYRIVNNTCIDYFRSQARRPQISLDAALEAGRDSEAGGSGRAVGADVPQAIIDSTWDPEGLALRAEMAERIQSALLQIPTEQRLALILCDIQGLPYDEIAKVMETSLGTVKSRIARGREHLRRILTREGELSEPRRRPDSDKT
jgi:RNA polymerase sigma-70 factor, ECF subfamily